MRISIETNFPEIDAALVGLRQDIADTVTARSLNRTAQLGQTAMSKEIRSEFNLSAAKVREKLFITRAIGKRGLSLRADLYSHAKGKRRSINIINFAARQTLKGLTAKIKKSGGRVLVSDQGFIGNKGRTAFKRRGNARLPIDPIQTIDVPSMFNTRRINSRVLRLIQTKFPEVFAREMNYALLRMQQRVR